MFTPGIQYSPLSGVKEALASYLAWNVVFSFEDEIPTPEVFAQHALQTEEEKELIDRDINLLTDGLTIWNTVLEEE